MPLLLQEHKGFEKFIGHVHIDQYNKCIFDGNTFVFAQQFCDFENFMKGLKLSPSLS